MMYMMENYANNLEDIVTEKTGQLREAKRETEELLYKILPRYYASAMICTCTTLFGGRVMGVADLSKCTFKGQRFPLFLAELVSPEGEAILIYRHI